MQHDHSYFSALFAASKNFPDYIGIASGSSMALFGLSPLFLSLLASNYFTSDIDGLDVQSFVTFLAVLSGLVNLVGAINLRVPQSEPAVEVEESGVDEESIATQSTSERAPLLAGKSRPKVQVTVVPVESQTVLDLLKEPNFWVLGLATLICLGSVSLSIDRDTIYSNDCYDRVRWLSVTLARL